MKRIIGFLLAFLFIFNSLAFANTQTETFLNSINNDTIKSSSIGGEWLIIKQIKRLWRNKF